MRKSQGVLRYSKPSGTNDEQPNQLRSALLWAGTGARWPPSLLDWMPSLYGQRGTGQLQELCPHDCYVPANALLFELMNTQYSWEPSLFRSPRKTYLLTSEARDWQSCAAGCFGYASQMNAVTQPGYGEGKQQHLCLLWYTAGEGMRDGLYFYQRTPNWRTQFKQRNLNSDIV